MAIGSASQPGRMTRNLQALKTLRRPTLAFFGFAFARAWNDLAFSQVAPLVPDAAWVGQDLLTLAMSALFLAGILLARRVVCLGTQRWPYGCAAVVYTASAPLLVYGTAWGTAALAIGAVLAGLAGALSILMWAELQRCFNSYRMTLYVCGGFFFGALLGWLLAPLEGARLLVALLILPACSLACLASGWAHVAACDMPKATWGRLHFPWRLVLALGVYEFVLGMQETLWQADGAVFALGVMVPAAALFLFACSFANRFDFTLLFRTPFLFMMCGLLATLTSLAGAQGVAGFLVSAGYSSMFILLTVLLCDISHRYGISVLVLCGIEELISLAMIAGHDVGWVMSAGLLPIDATDSSVPAALAMLVLVASLALFFGGSNERWGVTFFGAGRLSEEGDARGIFVARCADIASTHGLSPREKEVFQLIALGKTASVISDELCISEGTLKSHTQRIYQKLGIHSRDELHALVGAPPA